MIEGLILSAANHLLGQADWARRRLRGFAGRHARFEMPPWRLEFRIGDDGLFAPASGEAVDVTVSLPAETPLVALQGIDRAMAQAHVTGNAEFATELSFVFKNLRWDAEEDLARRLGDIVAHRIVAGASRLAAWQRQAARNLGENLAEYLADEAGILTHRRDLARFREELTEFSRRLERLDARARALA